jgi:glycine/serine hydroxymethyltransferase
MLRCASFNHSETIDPDRTKGSTQMKAATKKATAPVKPGSGARIRELILKGLANDAILVIIQKEFKGANTTTGDVSWNRSMLKSGKFDAPKKVLSNAEAVAKSAKPKAIVKAKPAEVSAK